MSLIKSWNWGSQYVLLMKNTHDGDIWPGWTANWNMNGLRAPYGEQTSWDYSTDKYAFNAYYVCGNQNWYEGEGGWTYDSLRIDECDDSYVLADVQDQSLDELDMLFSYTAEIELDDDYAICSDCKIEMEWNSIFQPSYMTLTTGSSTGTCTTSVNSGTTSCTTGVNLDGGSVVRFTFYDMLINTAIGSGLTSTVHFFEKFWVYGNWNRGNCIYNCDSLENSNQVTNCKGFVIPDNRITISDKPRWLEIREVRLIPNNA